MNLRENVELKPLTWMKVGGPADYYCEVRTQDELREVFRFARDRKLPLLYLGQGSNMVLSDLGFRGVVVRLMNNRADIDLDYSNSEALVRVEGGKILSRLIRDCRSKALNGLDNFVGIPGVLGAAIRGNIGIPEEEIGELVHEVEIFDGDSFIILKADECEFVYRGSKLKDEYCLVWAVSLLVRKGDPPHKDEWLLKRVAKQPKGFSCGSFFKNPDPESGIYAGQIIDECGLKGSQVGGALISEMHANFLMNDGSASATDVLKLARHVKGVVEADRGVFLQNEVLIYNQFGEVIQL